MASIINNTKYPPRWLAGKLLEEDTEIAKMLRENGDDNAVSTADNLVHSLKTPPELQMINRRYETAHEVCSRVEKRYSNKPSFTEKVDEIVTHRVYGPLILLMVLGFTLWSIFEVATPFGGLMESGFEAIRVFMRGQLISAPWWVTGMIVDGVLLGVQQIFVYMFAVMLVFYLCYSIFEDSGYLSRGAYLMNGFMSWLGLPGKAFMSLFAGLGCSISGVMATRILRNEEDRILTCFVTPMVPCSARIAVIVTIVPLFFDGLSASVVTLLLFGVSFLAIILVTWVLKRRILSSASAGMIMEMPAYRVPLASNVLKNTAYKTYESMKKAVLVFIPFSILMWVSFNMPVGEIPYALRVASVLNPLAALIGVSGKDFLPFMFSFPAKELTLLYLNYAHGYGLNEQVGFLHLQWSPLQAFSWLVFMTLYTPCLATISALADELKSWRWPLLVFGQEIITGFLFAGIAYWGGTLVFWGLGF